MYSKTSIFATLGFASVKLRFARHKDCSREPQESSKRAVRELLESLWEPLGGPWGCLGGLGALLGGAWALLGLSRSLRGRNIAPGEPNITQDTGYRKTHKKRCFLMFFCILRLPQDRPAPPPETSRELQESLGEASGSLIRV